MARNPKMTYHQIVPSPNMDASVEAVPQYIMEKYLKTAPQTDPNWRIRVMTNNALIAQGLNLQKWGSSSAFGLFSGLVGLFFILFFI